MKLVKYTEVGKRWVTIKQGHLKGRKILIDDKGFIAGGNVPKAFQGHHIGQLKHIGSEENPYSNYSKDELHEIHKDFWEAHHQDKQEFKSLVHETARTLKDLHDQKFGDNYYITNRVKQRGGIRAPKKTDRFGAEYHESIPSEIKRMVGRREGMALDEMADELGMSASQLIDRLSDVETKGKLGIRDFYRDAERTIDQMHGEGEIKNRKQAISDMKTHLKMIEDAIRDKMIEEKSKKESQKEAKPKNVISRLAASFIDKAGRFLVKKGKQEDSYYPSDRYAYKVHHSKDPIYIPVNRIRTPYQTEAATNENKVKENIKKIKNGETIQPIVIGYNYDLHDGHHRLEAAKRCGHSHVPCVVGGRNERRVKAAESRYREVWKSMFIKDGKLLLKATTDAQQLEEDKKAKKILDQAEKVLYDAEEHEKEEIKGEKKVKKSLVLIGRAFIKG